MSVKSERISFIEFLFNKGLVQDTLHNYHI